MKTILFRIVVLLLTLTSTLSMSAFSFSSWPVESIAAIGGFNSFIIGWTIVCFVILLPTYLFVLLIMLCLRPFYCWYYKISKRVRNQEEMIAELKQTNELLEQLISKNNVRSENKNREPDYSRYMPK